MSQAGANERLRLGIVGGGLIAQAAHLPVLADLRDRFELSAIADPSEHVRTALAARYGIPLATADWETLMERDDLDAIAVCSPHGTHAEITLAALRAGLHVLVEKPLCLTREDADRICALRRETGLVVQVGYMKRYDPSYEALLESLPGDDSPLRFLDVVTHDPLMLGPPFTQEEIIRGRDVPLDVAARTAEQERAQVEQAVGRADDATVWSYATTYLAALIHDVNLIHGVLEALGRTAPGDPVSARTWEQGRGATVTVSLEDGVTWHATWLLIPGLRTFREHARFLFEQELHELELAPPYSRTAGQHRVTPVGDQRSPAATPSAQGDPYAREWEHFHDCLVSGMRCRTPAEQGRSDIALLRELYRLERDDSRA